KAFGRRCRPSCLTGSAGEHDPSYADVSSSISRCSTTENGCIPAWGTKAQRNSKPSGRRRSKDGTLPLHNSEVFTKSGQLQIVTNGKMGATAFRLVRAR